MMFLPTLLLYICVIAASERINIYLVYFWIQVGCLLIAWVVLWIVAVGQSMGGGSSVNDLILLYLPQAIIPVLVAVTFITRLSKVDKNEENISKKISKISPTSIYEKIWQ